jgi:hypothetical protein
MARPAEAGRVPVCLDRYDNSSAEHRTGRRQLLDSAYRLMARKWAATPAITSRWNTSW